MTSSFTTNKKIEKPAYQDYASDPTGWTSPVNTNWDTIDKAFGGTHTPSAFTAGSSDVTLTADQCRNVRILLTGTTATPKTINIFFPATLSGFFIIDNASDADFTFNIKVTGATGSSEYVTAAYDTNTFVWVDSATLGVYLADSAALTAGNGISVVGSTVSLATPVSVVNGGTGRTSYTSGQLLIGNAAGGLTAATLTAGNSNITITNGDGTITISAAGGAAGVTTFNAGTTGFLPNTNAAGAVTLTGTLNVSNGGTGGTTQAAARTGLGLGTMATQDSSSVSITGGSVSAGTVSGGGVRSGTGLAPSFGYTFTTGSSSFASSGTDATINFSANTSLYSTGSGATFGISVGGADTARYTSSAFAVGPGITQAQCYFGTTWTNISDARVKTDVTPYALGTAALNQLRPVNYIYNGDYGTPKNGIVQTGLIAQEVLTTPLSSMVGTRVYTDPKTGVETTLYDLNTNQLVFALVNAVKELTARVTALEAKTP
jgi:hypothetical protein